MSTKSNTMENGKKITKHDLLTLFFRCFLLPACYSMDRMQAPGFAYSIIPVLKKLYGDNKEKLSQALSRHSEVYNNTFACSPFVLGIAAAMEEEASENEDFDVSSINAIKVALMGPLSGIGDTFFWGTFRIIGTGIGISLAMQRNLLGPLLFLLIYNIPNFLVRYYGVLFGYKLGADSIDTLVSGGLMNRATRAASVMGLTVIGGMIASMVSIKIALVANFGSDVTLDVQSIFDEICPCMLPLAATFIVYKLLKKGVKAYWIMLGIIAVGIVGKFFGIL